MFRLFRLIILLGLVGTVASLGQAQTRQVLQGSCERGGFTVTTDGRSSTTKVQRSFISCTVTVYDAGTTNLATIFSDEGGTPKANPFTADTDGYWSYWGDPGRYDVRFSGSGIPAPFTRSNLWIVSGGGGSGNTTACGGATTGTITKFTGPTTICNSIITESGTTDTVTGQFVINQVSTSTDALLVRAVTAATSPSFNVQDSTGATRFGTRPSGVPYFARFTSAPAVSASDTANLYYDESGGGMNGMLALSRDGAAYQFVISAATDGSAGQCLQTNGSKVFSFGACANVALPANEIGFGSGAGITSSSLFKAFPTTGYVEMSPFDVPAGSTMELRQLELAANGTAYYATKAPDALSTSRTMVWPSDDPSASDVLTVTSFAAGVITTNWSPGGAGTCPAGASHEVQYNLSGACAGAVGFTYYATNATAPNNANVQIVSQDSAGVALNLVYASVPATEDIFQVQRPNIAGNITWFAISYNGAPYTPADITGNTGAHFGFDSFAAPNGAAHGDNASSLATGAAIGHGAASGAEAFVGGYLASGTRAIVLGYQAFNNADGDFIAGSRQREINNIYFGPGGSETTGGSTNPITFYGATPITNNTSGGDMRIYGGRTRGTGGTPGAGSHGSIRLGTSAVDGSSGNAAVPANDRLIISGFKIFVSANNTPQSLFEIALPTLAGASGTVFTQVHCNDATDVQNVATQTTFAVVNKAGTYTKDVSDDIQNSALTGGSTLTVAGSLLDGTNKVTFQITPNSSLTCSATKYYVNWQLINNSDQNITTLP